MTENTPKALVQVNEKPLIEYQIEFLKEKGIHDIIIIVGYLKEQFVGTIFTINTKISRTCQIIAEHIFEEIVIRINNIAVSQLFFYKIERVKSYCSQRIYH